MAINTVVTRGYGNGTYTGTIGLVVTRGYTPGASTAVPIGEAFVVVVPERRAFSAVLKPRSLGTVLGTRSFTMTMKPGGRPLVTDRGFNAPSSFATVPARPTGGSAPSGGGSPPTSSGAFSNAFSDAFDND